MRDERLILALDGLDRMMAVELTQELGKYAYAVKIHDLYDREGPSIVDRLRTEGAQRVWVDFKLHDIAKTVERRARALKNAGASIVTVHASGSWEMVHAAVETGIEVYAITALTSLSDDEIQGIYGKSPEDTVGSLAQLAASAGAAGIVCSAKDVGTIAHLGSRFKRIVPGTRSVGAAAKGQKRSTTPAEALENGAHHLVIASQVVEAPDPIRAWQDLRAEIVHSPNRIAHC